MLFLALYKNLAVCNFKNVDKNNTNRKYANAVLTGKSRLLCSHQMQFSMSLQEPRCVQFKNVVKII